MINFIDIANSTTSYNFHTHTQFCDGHAPMADFVNEAIAIGVSHLGFTPHGPVPIESSCNMKQEDVQSYIEEIVRLRQTYGDRINIYAGMEVDYLNENQFTESMCSDVNLDYRIGSVHFIPSFDNPNEYIDIDGRFEKFKVKMKTFFHDDIEAVVKSYFKQSLEMVQAGGFEIVGHFDKIGLNASMFSQNIDEQPWYDHLVINLFEAIMDYGYIIEINTKAWLQHNRFFPNLKYFAMLKKYNATVLVNSDAHYPTLIDSGRPEALKLILG